MAVNHYFYVHIHIMSNRANFFFFQNVLEIGSNSTCIKYDPLVPIAKQRSLYLGIHLELQLV